MGLRDLAYRLYERRLEASLSPSAVPRHVGVMCDGNRRWARSAGLAGRQQRSPGRVPTRSSSCCSGAGTPASRSSPCGCCPPTTWPARPAELEPLLRIIEDTVRELAHAELARQPDGRARPAARRHRPRTQGRRRGDREPHGPASQRGRRLRRPPRDRRRGPRRCCRNTPAGAPRSRNWPRSSTSSTSPSISTRPASPTPTW